jgi:hypothetical protein
MKTNNLVAMLVLLVGIMLLSACSGGSSNGVGPSKTPFAGGQNGLSMEFIEGAPPNEIFDSGQFIFAINVKLNNLGEYDTKAADGYVEITGINPKDFGLNSQADLKKNLPGDINGVEKNSDGIVIIGGTLVSEFNNLKFAGNLRGNWGSDGASNGPRIRANLCYNYQTYVTTGICLKKDMLTNINTKEICQLNGEKKVFNSGAPIQVTKATQTPVGSGKIQVNFEISHVGTPNDRFYKFNTDCDDRSTNTQKDKVYFEVGQINGKKGKCTGLQEANADGSGGYVTLFNGRPMTVLCTFDLGNIEGSFETILEATLKYRYYQFIEKPILIKDVSVDNN